MVDISATTSIDVSRQPQTPQFPRFRGWGMKVHGSGLRFGAEGFGLGMDSLVRFPSSLIGAAPLITMAQAAKPETQSP